MIATTDLGSSVQTLLETAASRLRRAGIEHAWFESVTLACYVLDLQTSSMDKATLLAHPEAPVSTALVRHYFELIERRARSEPLAYLVGQREFYGRPFLVDKRALIPRPETELLIETALTEMQRSSWAELAGEPLIVDVGTGTGCIAATLALELPKARVIAVDVSAEALTLASKNLRLHRLSERVRLVRGDLLSWLRADADLVVANLPYIPAEAFDILTPDVRLYEPRLALDGGNRGTRLLLELLEQTSELQTGLVLTELDPRHADEVLAAAMKYFPGRSTRVLTDLAGHDRLLQVERAA